MKAKLLNRTLRWKHKIFFKKTWQSYSKLLDTCQLADQLGVIENYKAVTENHIEYRIKNETAAIISSTREWQIGALLYFSIFPFTSLVSRLAKNILSAIDFYVFIFRGDQ